MSGMSHEPGDQELLPFPEPDPGSPRPQDPELPPLPDPAAETPPRRPVPRSRRGAQAPPRVPSPREWADEALQQMQLRQGAVTETWGNAVDLLSRRIQEAGNRHAETTGRATKEIRDAMTTIQESVSTLTQQLGQLMTEVTEAVEKQTKEFRETAEAQGRTLVAASGEAATNIGVARHELALSVTELKRRTFRHGIVLGAATSLLILLAARLLFPFWGMQRSDVEAWSRGTQLLRTWEAAPEPRREAILRELEWREMPSSGPRSASPAPPADGR